MHSNLQKRLFFHIAKEKIALYVLIAFYSAMGKVAIISATGKTETEKAIYSSKTIDEIKYYA